MFSVIKRNPVSVMLAVLLHVLIVVFLVFGFDWSKIHKPATPNANVVQAHTVDAKQLDQAKEKEQAIEREKQRKEALKRKQAEEKKRQQLEQKRIAKQKAERQKQEAERKRQAQLKKEREAKEAKRKAEEKRLAVVEAKRKAEVKRKAEAEAKRKAELEKKRKAELEARRKAEAKRKAEAAAQAERERALQEQLAAEQNSREIDRYVAVIKQQIERNWLKPGQAGKELSCIVQVRLIPGGDVVPGGVSIVSSSGNSAFDRSVETAVYKAAPLQVPSGPLFESFRTLRLKFKPSS
ncbi:MAG: cell envelope integrity protein TolA [Candidatus Thiodiazotropha endolucinida]